MNIEAVSEIISGGEYQLNLQTEKIFNDIVAIISQDNQDRLVVAEQVLKESKALDKEIEQKIELKKNLRKLILT